MCEESQLTSATVVGDRASTMGNPNAETMMVAVMKKPISLQGLDVPPSSEHRRDKMMGTGAIK